MSSSSRVGILSKIYFEVPVTPFKFCMFQINLHIIVEHAKIEDSNSLASVHMEDQQYLVLIW